MFEVPTKPRITPDVHRENYAMFFILRHRRNWEKMSVEERCAVLTEGATLLQEYAAQMLSEIELLRMPA